MKISRLSIHNFKSVDKLVIKDIDDVLILVGRNNSGKSVILDAIRAVAGSYFVTDKDFHSNEGNIVIGMTLDISNDDLVYMHNNGVVGKYKRFELWKKDFCQKLPSFVETEAGGTLTFEYVYGRDGSVKYRDATKKNNLHIGSVIPKIYYIDHYRNQPNIKDDLLMLQQDGGGRS